MDRESSLYELVWGEPPPAKEAPDGRSVSSRPPGWPVSPESEGLIASESISKGQSSARGTPGPLGAIEASVGELLETAQRLRASSELQETLLITLEALESRISRIEKGLFRSLEYLESRISAAEQHY